MVRTHVPAASGTNANDSRWGGVCSRRERRESWLRPFRRTRRAIQASLRLIDSTRRLIDACQRSAVDHPLLVTRRLACASTRLCKVSERLGRGLEGWNETSHRLALSPLYAGDAPELLIAAITRWTEAATQLAALSNRVDDTFSWLFDYVSSGAPLDLNELFRKDGPAPRLTTRRSLPAALFSERSRIFCIHVRRRRRARLTVVEAPVRIFRGRAPPAVSTCSL
jgi:hypothetical protein